MRPYAAGVCGLKLLVYEALRYLDTALVSAREALADQTLCRFKQGKYVSSK
jgi:hypothetical protein